MNQAKIRAVFPYGFDFSFAIIPRFLCVLYIQYRRINQGHLASHFLLCHMDTIHNHLLGLAIHFDKASHHGVDSVFQVSRYHIAHGFLRWKPFLDHGVRRGTAMAEPRHPIAANQHPGQGNILHYGSGKFLHACFLLFILFCWFYHSKKMPLIPSLCRHISWQNRHFIG